MRPAGPAAGARWPGRDVPARVRSRWRVLRDHLAPSALDALGEERADLFLTRLEHAFSDGVEALDRLYGDTHDVDSLMRDLAARLRDAVAARPADLARLDRRREIDPAWFQRSRHVGYVAYVDRFAGTVAGVADRLDHLEALGVTYLHLMPLLRSREGADDGGYAVVDYRQVAPHLGTMDDLERLARRLRERGMSLCLDVVMNHTAREHEWARRARRGEPEYLRRYLTFPDRSLPDRYEATLREVFPASAPGNFTFEAALGRWVWTTFHEWQWDLDYANPDVFSAMLDVMLHLANRGVEVLRLDAVPFLWKRMGTGCENLPEVHMLLQAYRALVKVAAPAVLFKAEAIVAPDDLVGYLGAHERFRPECDLAYNNQLMVMLWSALASRDTRLAVVSLSRMAGPPPSTTWVNYVRVHDDIGWAVADVDAAALGWDGARHRGFLADFFAGNFEGSFARGARFQDDPATGDARTSGTAASLCGVEQALERPDAALLEAAARRLVLLYAMVFAYDGIPLVYMGDELALRNDTTYLSDPARRGDNRWMHRPPMDWDAAARRHVGASLEGRVFDALADLARARAATEALRGGGQTSAMGSGNDRVLAFRRRHPRTGGFLALGNFSDEVERVPAGLLGTTGLAHPAVVCASPGDPAFADGFVELSPWGFAWFAD